VAALTSGCSIAYHTNPLEARTVGDLCRKHGVTLMISTPTFAWKYIQSCTREDFASAAHGHRGRGKDEARTRHSFEEKFGKPMF